MPVTGAGATTSKPATTTSSSSTGTGTGTATATAFKRTSVSRTTPVLTPGDSATMTVQLSVAYRLYAIQTSVAARVRIYSTPDAAARDFTRPAGTVPTPDAGVYIDYVTKSDLLRAVLSPMPDGADLKTPTPDGLVAMTVTNLGTDTGPVDVILTYIRTE